MNRFSFVSSFAKEADLSTQKNSFRSGSIQAEIPMSKAFWLSA